MAEELIERIRLLTSQPANRRKYLIVALFGLLFGLIAVISQDPWKAVLIEFSVTFGAIALLRVLWELVGGDPAEELLTNVTAELDNEIRSVRTDLSQAISTLSRESSNGFRTVGADLSIVHDLLEYDLGIERFWPNRRTFRDDPRMGITWWRNRIFQSKDISILSITLWTDWMQDREFQQGIFNAVKRGSAVRLIVYEPGSEIQILRAMAENDPGNEMVSEINRTVNAVRKMRNLLPEDSRNNLEIRFNFASHHLVQLFRCDSEMLVSFYLHGMDGLSSPTMYVRGSGRHLYRIYSDQFDRLWTQAKPIPDL